MSDPLPIRPLGRTGLRLTEIGLGAAPLGGSFGAIEADSAAATVRAGWDLGIRYFDVAPLYGAGRAELLLGHVLRELPRDDFVVSTKVGRYLRPPGPGATLGPGLPFELVLDYSRDGTLRALDQSFQRLGLPRLDIVMIHDVDAQAQRTEEAAERCFAEAMGGAYPVLAELRAAGVIRAIGVGVNQVAWARRWLAETDIDCVMIAGRLSLLNQEARDELLPECAGRGVGVLVAGAFNGGFIARGPGTRFNYRPAPPEVVERLGRLQRLAETHGVDLKAAAVQYPLRHPEVSAVVLGAMSPVEIEQNVLGRLAAIPDALWAGV